MLMEDHHWLPFNGFCLKPHIDAVQTSVNDLLFLISYFITLMGSTSSSRPNFVLQLATNTCENTYMHHFQTRLRRTPTHYLAMTTQRPYTPALIAPVIC